MTTAPAIFGQFGQTLAFAERTLSATLRNHLAQRDTQPETWYALRLIATRGPGLSRQELSDDLAGSPALDADSTRELLARLEAQGVVTEGLPSAVRWNRTRHATSSMPVGTPARTCRGLHGRPSISGAGGSDGHSPPGQRAVSAA